MPAGRLIDLLLFDGRGLPEEVPDEVLRLARDGARFYGRSRGTVMLNAAGLRALLGRDEPAPRPAREPEPKVEEAPEPEAPAPEPVDRAGEIEEKIRRMRAEGRWP